MKQIKVISRNYEPRGKKAINITEKEVNDWLQENDNIIQKMVDVKFYDEYVIIIYEEKYEVTVTCERK